MNIISPLPAGQILSLWAEAADRLLTQDHGDAALLYLHILRKNNPFPQNWELPRVRHAQGVLQSMGLLPSEFQGDLQLPSHVPKQTSVIPPDYTTEDLNTALGDGDGEFRSLTENVEQQLGKALTSVDVKMLLEIYDHLELPVEVILMVVTTCIRQQELAKSSRKLPNMTAIKKEAMTWQNKGIVTLDSAMAYTAELSKLNHQQGAVIQIFQLKTNTFTQRDREFLQQWNQWGFPLETYHLALERCLNGIGEFKWPYVNGIFKKWHERNIHTPEEIMAQDKSFQYSYAPTGAGSVKHMPKGPYARDTMVASETTAPSPEQSKRMQEDFDAMKRLLEEF